MLKYLCNKVDTNTQLRLSDTGRWVRRQSLARVGGSCFATHANVVWARSGDWKFSEFLMIFHFIRRWSRQISFYSLGNVANDLSALTVEALEEIQEERQSIIDFHHFGDDFWLRLGGWSTESSAEERKKYRKDDWKLRKELHGWTAEVGLKMRLSVRIAQRKNWRTSGECLCIK